MAQRKKETVVKSAIKTIPANLKKSSGAIKELTWSLINKDKEKGGIWETKDRYYHLKDGETKLTRIIKSKGIMWYDPEMKYEREVTYTTNQKTPFVDDFKGNARLEKIIFRDGVLFVPKEKRVLQQILSHLHPDLGKVYYERDDEAQATDDLELLELEIEALNLAREMDIDIAEAIVRTKVGSMASKMDSKSIKRDLMLLAKENPILFIELANDDDIEMRNDGIKGVEQGIINLTNRNSLFVWASNGNKLCKVPFDEEPYQTLVRFFKTDEGVDVYKTLKKQLSEA